MRLKRYVRVLAVPMIAAMAMGTNYAASAASASSSPHIRGITATTIRIAGNSTLTIGGEPFQLDADIGVGAAARFWEANKQGGVDGRKIDYLGTLDDAATTSTLVDNLSKEILNENVYAISPFSSVAAADLSLLSQDQVPTFGFLLSPLICASKWTFGIGGCIEDATYEETTLPEALAEAIVHHVPNKEGVIVVPKGDTFASIGNVSAASENGDRVVETAAKHLGFTVCDISASIPVAGVTDFSTYAAQVMNACDHGKGPTGADMTLDTPTQTASMVDAIRALGWKGQLEQSGYDPAELQSPTVASALKGAVTYLDNVDLPPELQTYPIYKEIRTALAAIGDSSTQTDVGMLLGWESASLTVDALKKADGNFNPAHLVKVLNDHWTDPGVPGLLPPTTFPVGHSEPVPCWNDDKVVGTHWVALYSYTCGQVLNSYTGKVAAEGFTP